MKQFPEEALDFIKNSLDATGVLVVLQHGEASEIRAKDVDYIRATLHVLMWALKNKTDNPTKEEIIGMVSYLGNMLIENMVGEDSKDNEDNGENKEDDKANEVE